MKYIAADLGVPFDANNSSRINDGYPVFRWQTEPDFNCGDINDDGFLKKNDVNILQDYLVNFYFYDVGITNEADINNDKRVDVFDLILLKRMLSGAL